MKCMKVWWRNWLVVLICIVYFGVHWLIEHLATYFNLCYPESCLQHARMMCILLVMAFGGRERRGFWRWWDQKVVGIKPYTVIIKQIRCHRRYYLISQWQLIDFIYICEFCSFCFFCWLHVDIQSPGFMTQWQEILPLSPSPGHTWAGWWTRMAPRFVVTRAMLQTCRSMTGICHFWGPLRRLELTRGDRCFEECLIHSKFIEYSFNKTSQATVLKRKSNVPKSSYSIGT